MVETVQYANERRDDVTLEAKCGIGSVARSADDTNLPDHCLTRKDVGNSLTKG
jgi:hypothetical protein